MLRIHEQERIRLSPHMIPFSFLVSDDGEHIAFAVSSPSEPGHCQIVLDGKAVSYRFSSVNPMRISPDGKRVAYLGTVDDEEHVVLDGVQQSGFRRIEQGSLEFSPNSRRFAYVGEKHFRKFAVIDGVEHGPYCNIERIVFSPDSSRAIFQATAVRPFSHFVVDNGRECRSFEDGVFGATLSPDGKQLAYIAKSNDAYFVIHNEKTIGPFRYADSLHFSSDSKHWMFVSERAECSGNCNSIYQAGDLYCLNRLYIDGEPGQEHWRIQSPRFLGDGNRVAFVAGLPGEQFLFMGQARSVPFDFIVSPVYVSPNHKRHAFAAIKNRRRSMVIDGDAIDAHRGVGKDTFAFSQNSQHYCFEIETDRGRAVVYDGQVGKSYSAILRGTPILSPNGDRCAYSAQTESHYLIVVDGVEQPGHFDAVFANTFTFSPNGNHLIFCAERKGASLLVVDGRESPVYDGFCNSPRFIDDEHMIILAIQKDCIVQLRVDL